jgi:antitoxin VapB
MEHEPKTEAVRQAPVEQEACVQARGGPLGRKESLLEFLEREVWPHMPPGELGRTLTREEEDDILGFFPVPRTRWAASAAPVPAP